MFCATSALLPHAPRPGHLGLAGVCIVYVCVLCEMYHQICCAPSCLVRDRAYTAHKERTYFFVFFAYSFLFQSYFNVYIQPYLKGLVHPVLFSCVLSVLFS